MILAGIGIILFFSVFFSAASSARQSFEPGSLVHGGIEKAASDGSALVIRALIGMALASVGAIISNIGAKGLAGSGVILDPEKAREDLEPYSRMAGGMVKDAFDEADINVNATPKEVIKVRCQSCGKLNEESAKFCNDCGKPI